MPWSLQWQLALRQTLDPGKGLSAFLSRVSIVGIALAIALLLAVQSVMNGFDREMRERILTLIPHVQIMGNASGVEWQQLQAEAYARRTVRIQLVGPLSCTPEDRSIGLKAQIWDTQNNTSNT